MLSPKSICFLLIALLANAICWTTTGFASHPYHVSYAEVEWNAQTGNFEVALCVWAADLEKVISAGHGTSVDLDETEDLDRSLEQLVREHFRVVKKAESDRSREGSGAAKKPNGQSINVVSNQKNKKASVQPISWAGHELSLKKAWLYFEVSGDKRAAEWEIENRMFFDINQGQQNYMRVAVNDRIENLRATEATTKQVISTMNKK